MIHSTLREWKKNCSKCKETWPRLNFYIYETIDGAFCLAKVLGQHRYFKGNAFQLIQIGSGSTVEKERIFRQNVDLERDTTSNFVWVFMDELILPYVPISLSESDYVNNDEHDEHIQDRRWIITNKIFNDGLDTCLKAIQYAKNGDWLRFKAEIINNSDIV